MECTAWAHLSTEVVMNEITNENGEAYIAVSQYGEATITESGFYHVEHSALYEDRYLKTTFVDLLHILNSLDLQIENRLAG